MADINVKVPCWYGPYCKINDEPACRKICHIYLKMNYFIMNCGMPNAEKYLKELHPTRADVTAYKHLDEIRKNIAEFVAQGNNLFIYSPIDQNGKTTWSLKILYRYFHEIWSGSEYIPRGYFLYVPDFIDKTRSFQYKESEEYKELDKILKTADLVIWDNITQNRLLESDQNLINKYVNKRFMEGKSNIFNGQLPEQTDDPDLIKKSLEQQVGKILTQKLNLCEKVVLIGKA